MNMFFQFFTKRACPFTTQGKGFYNFCTLRTYSLLFFFFSVISTKKVNKILKFYFNNSAYGCKVLRQ